MPATSKNRFPNCETLCKPNRAEYAAKAPKGLSRALIERISKDKNEPSWMLSRRLACLDAFYEMPMPDFGPDLSKLDLDEIIYYAKPDGIKNTHSWKNVPRDIKKTFETLGIPEAEKNHLAGAGAQYESINIYHKLKEEWRKLGIIFEDMDAAVRLYPDIVKKHFMKCVSMREHKFAALHGAVWSGGTFIHIPAGAIVGKPLQAYFRMNAQSMGQFEHTLIIVGDNAQAGYIEGCSAPQYNSPSLHAGMVEIFVEENARFRYSSVENWSNNTYNLNTKRAIVEKNGTMEWVSGNFGAGVTMLYPCSVLKGEGARTDHLGIACAKGAQIQDIGAKVVHAAPNTTSKILSKSLSKNGGSATYRGNVKILKGAKGASTHVKCDSLLLDENSKAGSIPALEILEHDACANHEATAGKINEEQLFYCMSRGIGREEAVGMIINGFIEPIVKEMPLEYAVEMNRLIETA